MTEKMNRVGGKTAHVHFVKKIFSHRSRKTLEPLPHPYIVQWQEQAFQGSYGSRMEYKLICHMHTHMQNTCNLKREKILPFELYKNPAETEEVVQAVILPKIVMQWRIKKLHKLRHKRKKKLAH